MLMGRLFEDIEVLASNIAFNHCDYEGRKTPLNLITISIDKLRRNKTIKATDDLMLTGQVVWVGNTSIDVLVELHRTEDVETDDGEPVLIKEGVKSRLLSSLLTYVCKDRRNGQSVRVNKLIPGSEEEESLFNRRQSIAETRRNQRKTEHRSISRQDDMFLKTLVERGIAAEDMPALAHTNSVLMRQTVQENSMICQPQMTNIAGRIFGGFLSKL
jgi:acyl-coenzyme A thioesterase 9